MGVYENLTLEQNIYFLITKCTQTVVVDETETAKFETPTHKIHCKLSRFYLVASILSNTLQNNT